MSVKDTLPDRVGGAWGGVQLESGPALVDIVPSGLVRIAQQRSGRRTVAVASTARRRQAVVDDLELAPAGTRQLADDSADPTIAAHESDLSAMGRTTCFELPDDLVETPPAPHPLAPPAHVDRIEPTTLHDGRRGTSPGPR